MLNVAFGEQIMGEHKFLSDKINSGVIIVENVEHLECPSKSTTDKCGQSRGPCPQKEGYLSAKLLT